MCTLARLPPKGGLHACLPRGAADIEVLLGVMAIPRFIQESCESRYIGECRNIAVWGCLLVGLGLVFEGFFICSCVE